jgi:predicted nuclease of predicted toxin-antitoxin system
VRILFDECMDRGLARELPGHEVKTARQMGWLSIKNGALLALAASEFDVFITIDSKMSSQQNVMTLPLPVIVLRARSRRPTDVWALAPALRKALESVPSQPVTVIGPL